MMWEFVFPQLQKKKNAKFLWLFNMPVFKYYIVEA